MEVTTAQVDHFHTHGFFFVPNPFGEERMREIDQIAVENEEKWANTDWPTGLNKLACQFLTMGEPILQIVEQPQLVETAKRLLDCEQVHVGACGLGDALRVISESQGLHRQVYWHADGGPDVKQVSFRTGLDRHDPTNAPLRILPGSHLRAKEEIWEELLQLEIATGQHDLSPKGTLCEAPCRG